ncbi:MAG: hypothetical protein GF309_00310 [Candidatus Lokiarchaeota archaeon]|nr:hypothetical protein [Candidatus Lokiarchaeota archaeon]
MDTYNRLMGVYRETAILRSIRKVLAWDRRTALPPKGESQRSEQQALLAQLVHRALSRDEIGKLLDDLEKGTTYDNLSQVQKRNVTLVRLDYEKKTRVPNEVVGRVVKQRAMASRARDRALKKKDWAIFETELAKLFSVHCELLQYLRDIIDSENLYDVSIDAFDHGLRTTHIASIFDEMKSRLPELIEEYAYISQQSRADFLSRPVEKATQIKIVERLAEFIGYDLTSEEAFGRIGEGPHPSTIGDYDDVRILLNYEKSNLFRSCISFLHEAGHSLHSRNIKEEWRFLPVGNTKQVVISESQARFTENIIGRSPEFMEYYLPLVNEITYGQFDDVAPLEFARAVNQVRPVPIRVVSDEISYNLHIIIRFEIESRLFQDEIKVSEIPAVWRELCEKYLGIEVEDVSVGPLQDIHWSLGMFGYFPTYALGNIVSAQLVAAMTEDIPNWKQEIRLGNVSNVLNWMDRNIHKKGNLYDTPQLVEEVTGDSMSCEPFISYLENKFSTLYQ